MRPGLARDASALRAIRLEALRDSPDAYGETYAECEAWDEQTWALKAQEWNFYLAESDGQVVGMARGESHDDHLEMRFLFAMYVSPSARGTDAARLLVDAVSAWASAQGVTTLYLYVSIAVPRARAFYSKVDFVATGSSLSMHRDEALVCDEMGRDLANFAFDIRRVAPQELYDLRRRVLRDDTPAVDVSNPADDLESAVHFGGFLGERAVVSASFYAVAAPFAPEKDAYQLRYMATDFDVQGCGLGAQLLARALEELTQRGANSIWANARTSALSFYEATGWSVLPDSLFVSRETGIDHVVIFRSLGQGSTTL
ncbi:MAG: GNAT family N-acetyltransferase [Acidimicrobiaceae bacterium]|nr:GNAT family N-acetyltransferase [Acidimicrobiaceae bacterium]